MGNLLQNVSSPNIGTHFFAHARNSVDSLGRHGPHRKKNSGKFFRHAELNRFIQQSISSIPISSLLEPTGLFLDHSKKKRPDGITYTAWETVRHWYETLV